MADEIKNVKALDMFYIYNANNVCIGKCAVSTKAMELYGFDKHYVRLLSPKEKLVYTYDAEGHFLKNTPQATYDRLGDGY